MVIKLKAKFVSRYKFCCKIEKNTEKPGKTEGKLRPIVEKDVVLTTKEAVEYLKISRPTFLKYIHLGRIRATRAVNGWRVHQSELYRFLKVGGESP
jgi:excisionase family DNA binding protein